MRKEVISGITVEYPDEISFCFNPVVINVSGYTGASVVMTVIDIQSEGKHEEKRAMFGATCFFDVSFYMQSAFDMINFNEVDYSISGAQDSKLGRLFSVELDFYDTPGTLADSFQFNVFVIWGAMKIGERYNGDRVFTWFKNFPFSVGMYTAGSSSINVIADGISLAPIVVNERKVHNLMLKEINAENELVFNLPGSSTGANVFDNTFDFTFMALMNVASNVRLLVDNSDEGVYLRWINRHGFYCYWLFKRGDESRQVTNDGEFIRNNMQDYSYVNGYHGGTGRKQKKTEENTLLVCAPLVDSDMYDFLFQLALSPVVDMYMGFGSDIDCWMGVNVSVGTYNKTRAVLQDFVATIVLPETRVQSL
ncbi:hypothetical protein [Bacteroides stercorirosoris]|uniref:Uncharacterized protein n=1 Tax=Bacteroides stercorirosoris TaxID=871324 RepID=A0A1M6FKQ4_9BACE|nr:hypothetical protein [Bacteroides stercorirosoris]SHI98255.1 hypothetical protein SAMN05444350_11285 [Bacteroides stercorirosoris]